MPYVTKAVLKNYLNLPELIFLRVLKQINPSGDEQIEHREFLNFFFKITCGSFKHKMHVAFLLFDVLDT